MRLNIFVFVCGVWLLQQQAALPGWAWLWLLPGLALAWLLPIGKAKLITLIRWTGIKGFFFVAGFFWAVVFAQVRLSDALPIESEGRDVDVVGVVAALPQKGERGTRFEFDVERVATPEAIVPRHIQLNWYALGFREDADTTKKFPELHAGERWRLTVRLKRPRGNANPHGFDFEAWMLERNIRAVGYVRESVENKRINAFVMRPSYLVEVAREAVSQRFQKVLHDQPFEPVLAALAIGDQSAIPQAQWQVFTRTGVNHLMSISGLHVTMVSGLVFALIFRLWRMSAWLTLRLPARKAAALAGACAALAYVLLAGFAVPAQRTLYMLTVVAVALWLGRVQSSSRVLSLALLVVTLLDPWAVLSPGFWLSFGAVAAILFVSAGRLERSHWLKEAVNTQWAVTLGLMPALLAMFQQVSLVSPIANAFAIPLVSLVVAPLTLLGAVLPFDFLLHAAHQIMVWTMLPLAWLSELPSAVWQQHAPPGWAVLLSLLGIAWLMLPRGFPARWLGVLPVLPLFLYFPPSPASPALWLTVLDVGQGLAVVVRTAHHALLYDTGPRYSDDADAGNHVILPYLRGEGIPALDGMIVTHDDSDHYGGAISVLDGMPVNWLLSSLPSDQPILDHSKRHIACTRGQSWQWDGVRFDVLHPVLSSYQFDSIKTNDMGCVVKITTAYGSVLLSADIERISEEELLAALPESLPATVLVVPHHGSKTSSTDAFVRRVHPAISVFTVGYRNRFGHPKAEVVARYRELGSRLLRSDYDGAVDIRFEQIGLPVVTTYRNYEQRYWQAGVR
jgi:competence protein ComEC